MDHLRHCHWTPIINRYEIRRPIAFDLVYDIRKIGRRVCKFRACKAPSSCFNDLKSIRRFGTFSNVFKSREVVVLRNFNIAFVFHLYTHLPIRIFLKLSEISYIILQQNLLWYETLNECRCWHQVISLIPTIMWYQRRSKNKL